MIGCWHMVEGLAHFMMSPMVKQTRMSKDTLILNILRDFIRQFLCHQRSEADLLPWPSPFLHSSLATVVDPHSWVHLPLSISKQVQAAHWPSLCGGVSGEGEEEAWWCAAEVTAQ